MPEKLNNYIWLVPDTPEIRAAEALRRILVRELDRVKDLESRLYHESVQSVCEVRYVDMYADDKACDPGSLYLVGYNADRLLFSNDTSTVNYSIPRGDITYSKQRRDCVREYDSTDLARANQIADEHWTDPTQA